MGTVRRGEAEPAGGLISVRSEVTVDWSSFLVDLNCSRSSSPVKTCM